MRVCLSIRTACSEERVELAHEPKQVRRLRDGRRQCSFPAESVQNAHPSLEHHSTPTLSLSLSRSLPDAPPTLTPPSQQVCLRLALNWQPLFNWSVCHPFQTPYIHTASFCCLPTIAKLKLNRNEIFIKSCVLWIFIVFYMTSDFIWLVIFKLLWSKIVSNLGFFVK